MYRQRRSEQRQKEKGRKSGGGAGGNGEGKGEKKKEEIRSRIPTDFASPGGRCYRRGEEKKKNELFMVTRMVGKVFIIAKEGLGGEKEKGRISSRLELCLASRSSIR